MKKDEIIGFCQPFNHAIVSSSSIAGTDSRPHSTPQPNINALYDNTIFYLIFARARAPIGFSQSTTFPLIRFLIYIMISAFMSYTHSFIQSVDRVNFAHGNEAPDSEFQ